MEKEPILLLNQNLPWN